MIAPWKARDRALDARSHAVFPPVVRRAVTEGQEVILLNAGTGKDPAVYLRRKLSMRDILRGRRATMPWRKVAAL